MKEMSDVLKTCELSGTPSAMGEAYGESFRDEIRAFAESRAKRLAEFIAKYDDGRGVSREHIRDAAAGLLPVHAGYDQSVWSEFRGIARGAGVDEADLLVANGLTDIRDLVLFENPEPAGVVQVPAGEGPDDGECTSFAVHAEEAVGGPLAGQTWDMHPDAIDFLVVVRRRPDRGPETLSLTTVGCLSLIGMNSEGVAVCNNNLMPTDPRPGVNYLFTITRALSCPSASEAVDSIENTRRLSGHNFVVVDREAAFNLETTAGRAALTRVRGSFVHANHHNAETTSPLEFKGVDLSGSRWREGHLRESFAAAARPLTPESCWILLADDTRGAGAVCNEDYDGVYGDSATVATVVMEPRSGTMMVASGGARLGRRQSFTV